MPQLTKKILLISISAALILVSLYPYSPKKDYRISITDQVEINFDSVYNTLLNDTFYFPKVFGDLNVKLEVDGCQKEIQYIKKHSTFYNRLNSLIRYCRYTSYTEFLLSEEQVVNFEQIHIERLKEGVALGNDNSMGIQPIELNFLLPRFFTKLNGEIYLVIDYVFRNPITQQALKFKSYRDFYLQYNNDNMFSSRIFYNWDNRFYCDVVSLNYPIILKWDRQLLSWQLRNSQEMFEADIKELGFREIPIN